MHRGRCYYAKHDFDKAIADFQMAIKYGSQDKVMYYNLGNSWQMKAEPIKALEAYTKSLALDPGYAAAQGQRGLCLVRMGRVEEGKKDVEQAIRTDPGQKAYLQGQLILILPQLKK